MPDIRRPPVPQIAIRGVTKRFVVGDGEVEALGRIDLTIDEAQFVCLIGASGCGKSTLLRIAHGFAWILIVVGEMTGVPTGLGSVIMDGRTLSRTDLVITGMIVIGAMGFITDRLIVMISNRVLSWSPQHHG